MDTYQLKYTISTQYKEEVRHASYLIMTLPCSNDDQDLISYSIKCSLGENQHIGQNHFGFSYIYYQTQKRFRQFDFELECEVEIRTSNPFSFDYSLQHLEKEILAENDFKIENHSFLQSTPFTFLKKEDTLLLLEEKQSLFDFLQQLNQYINDYLSYIPDSTTVNTTASELLIKKEGVCQDFTHLFIAICRNNGIPCRYVSGYLNQGNNLTGAHQLHAWAEVYVPHVGWIGFDPTNNLLVDHHYIKIAHDVDYKDCTPIKGVIGTTGEQISSHTVQVTNQ